MNLRGLALALVAGLVIGYGAGFYVTRPKKMVEKPLPAVRQADGSLVLERKPDAQAKPKQTIPKGDKVDRVVHVEVETLKPVTRVAVDLTVVSEPDGSKRVVASSPDGTVIGGTDIPVTPILIPKSLPWSAGAVYSPKDKKYGGFVVYRKGAYVAQVIVIGDTILVGAGLTF